MSGSIEESLIDLTTTEELSSTEEYSPLEEYNHSYETWKWAKMAMKSFYKILEKVDPNPMYLLSKEAHICNGCQTHNLPGPCKYRDCVVCGKPIPDQYEKGANANICINCDIQFVGEWDAHK